MAALDQFKRGALAMARDNGHLMDATWRWSTENWMYAACLRPGCYALACVQDEGGSLDEDVVFGMAIGRKCRSL